MLVENKKLENQWINMTTDEARYLLSMQASKGRRPLVPQLDFSKLH
jgi:hypothetical protein